jgi:hypothetical protein
MIIKSYLRNTISEDRLTALAMIFIEYSIIEAIPNFNAKVIDKFVADKVRRLEFSFKQQPRNVMCICIIPFVYYSCFCTFSYLIWRCGRSPLVNGSRAATEFKNFYY